MSSIDFRGKKDLLFFFCFTMTQMKISLYTVFLINQFIFFHKIFLKVVSTITLRSLTNVSSNYFFPVLTAKTRRAGSFFCPSKKPPSTVWSAAVEHATSAGLADAVQTFRRSMARRFAGQLPDAQRILRIARICSDRRPREGGCRGRPNDGKRRVICWPVITSPIFGRNELGYEWWTRRSQTLESLTQGWGHTGLWGRAEAVCVWSRSGTGFVLRLVWIVVRNEVVVVVDVAVP